MKIHVLTLNWNGVSKLMRLRHGLMKNLEGLDFQWYVRDNGSKDDSVKWLNDCEVTTLEIGHNRDSFAKGVNSLFELANPADEDFILLLNNDVEFVDDQSIKKMLDLQKKTKAEVVGARLLYPDVLDFKLQHAGVIFGERYNYLPYHFRHGELADGNSMKNRYFQSVTAAVCLVKASAFRKIGGLDEGFRWAFEDIDMCLSIGQFGKVAYCGETQIFHEESASLKKNPVNKMFVKQNVERFRKKWNGKYEIDHEMYLKNKNFNVIK